MVTKGLIIRQGTSINASWHDRMVIDEVPVAIQPSTFTVAHAILPGTLPAGTYYYVAAAVGIDGESTATAEATVTTTGQDVTVTFDAQSYVSEYHIYRGTASGVYDGYFRVYIPIPASGTISFTDDGLQSMDIIDGHVPSFIPPATNPQGGITLGGAFVGSAQRSILFFSEITLDGQTFQPITNTDNHVTPDMRIIHLKKGKNVCIDINLADVFIPSSWNTPNSDAGGYIALTDIQTWSVP